VSDDWTPDDAYLDSDDPEAQAREQRRQEREARRRERQSKQDPGEPEREAKRRPGEPEHPPPPSSGESSASPGSEGVPPPQRRLPSSPAGEPFAQRITAMRKRLAESRPKRPPREPREPRDGGGFGELLKVVRARWVRVAIGIVGLLLVWFLIALFQPFHGSQGAAVEVTIPKGASVSEVGHTLDDDGIVSSSMLFQIRITLAGKRSDIQHGIFTLHKNESYGDAIDDLTTPAKQRTTVTVTIPEGLSRSQIAPIARGKGLKGSYLKASVRSKYLHPNAFGAQGRAHNLEGFLFPDTYDLKGGAPVADLVQLQLQDFKRRIKTVNMKYARSKNLTTYDVLIIASMIEREVQVPSERKLVAAVIYNRLHRGMPLGIDATTRFAVGNYTEPLTESQLSSPSTYNTRLHAGLPPGPIGNPGLATIQAAAKPAKVNYIYYVVKPGTCGEHNFSSTNAQFAHDQAAYQRALKAKGSSPTSCPG
jgi:UPF0755 protein